MSAALLTGLLVVAVLVIAAIWVVGVYNSFVHAKQAVLASESGITVELRRRFDLIPALVDTVKANAKFQSDTLEKVIQARAAAMAVQGAPLADRAAAENMLTDTLKSLFALTEAYPDLKTDAFNQLQSQLEETEDRIAAGRRLYNLNIQSYNSKTQTMPNAIVKSMFASKFPEFAYFEDTNPAIQEMPKLDFGA